MAGNNSIQILRANSNTIASSAETLLPGQLIYNTDKNYLSIGGTEGNYDPVNKLPIACKELVGYYGDAESVGNNVTTSYSISGTGPNNAQLVIQANNGINVNTNNFEVNVNSGHSIIEAVDSNVNISTGYGIELNAQQNINILSGYDMNISSDTLHIDASQMSIKSGNNGFNISSSGICATGNFAVQGNAVVTNATNFMVMNTVHTGICAANVQICSITISGMGCMPGNGDIEINSAGELSLNAVGNIRMGSDNYYTYLHGNTRIDGSAIALNSNYTYFYTNNKLQCTVNSGGFYFNGPLYAGDSQQVYGLNCVATINWVMSNVPRFRHTLWVYFGSGAGGQQVTFDIFKTHDNPVLDQESLIMGAYLTPVTLNANTGFVPASGRIYDDGKYQNVIGFGLVNSSASYANFRFIVDGPITDDSGYTNIHMVTMCCARSSIKVRDFITNLF